IIKRSEELQKLNIKQKDSLHIACAIESQCDFFISTDYTLIRKSKNLSGISVINPINFILEMEERYDERT
ncbi:MAG: hypothetical protein LBC68_03665, partial [Prevotellaceae bacterium]|nr:hypothetical protein [Prevotellaceae bacterium]